VPIRSPFGEAAREAARDLRRLPSDARKVVGREVQAQVAEPLADAVRAAYAAGPPMAAALSGQVKTRINAEPVVSVGGARRLVSGGAAGRQLVYGVEFGSGTHPQRAERLARRSHHGTGRKGSRTRGTTAQFAGQGGHYVFGTFARQAEATFDRWLGILETVLDEWGARRGG
jgi:hypothetical protein